MLLRPAVAVRSLHRFSHHPHRCPRHSIHLTFTRTRMTSSYPPSSTTPSTLLAGKPKVLVIAGPTGVGKTKLSLLLAARLNGEIVSADSVQLYRHLDIGSNKLPATQRTAIPHHCIDCADLTDDLTVADWHAMATAAIADITARGKLPIVTGGTMLYFRWLLYGQPLQVETAKESRQRADEWIAESTEWEEKVERLQLSEESRSYLEGVRAMNCSHRLSRAVEILMLSNKPPPPLAVPGRDSLPAALEYDARCVLLTADRTWLCRQLDYRCEEMMEQGLIEETYLLSRNGALQASTQAASIGYRQVLDFLAKPEPSVSDFRELLATFQGATRRYLRRQLTFFRTEDVYRFLIIPTPAVPEDRKGQLAALLHPTTFQLSDATFDQLTEQVAGYVAAEPDQYWSELCHNTAIVQQQQRAREETKEQPNAPSRRYYITRSFVFDKVEKVEAVLERLRRLREADKAAAASVEEKTNEGLDGDVSDEMKEPDEKKMKLLDSVETVAVEEGRDVDGDVFEEMKQSAERPTSSASSSSTSRIAVERSEMERALKHNLENVYTVYRLRKQQKPSQQAVLLFNLNTINGDWSEQTSPVQFMDVERARALRTEEGGEEDDVIAMFDHLGRCGRHFCCGVIIQSHSEAARSETFCLDFDRLMPELARFPPDVDIAASFCRECADLIDQRWGLGARVFTDQAFGLESRGWHLLGLTDASSTQLTAARQMAAREFTEFATEVRLHLEKTGSEGHLALVDGEVAGFVLFNTTVQSEHERVVVDIKYLLVAAQHRGGLGTDIVSAMLDEVVSVHRQRTIRLITDIKTTSAQAPKFWLVRKGFVPREGEEYVEGVWQPVEKTYVPAHLFQ